MKNYLQSIEKRIGVEDPAVIIWEVDAAFREAIQESPESLTQRALELHELVRFCKFDAIAPWLRDQREAVGRVLAFTRKLNIDKVADILEAALNGEPQDEVSFSVTLHGQAPRILEVDAGEITKFAGKDWGGTDIALSFAISELEDSVLHALVVASREFDLRPPLEVRQRIASDAEADGIVKNATAAKLFNEIVSAKHPRMLAGPYEDIKGRVTDRAITISLKHIKNPPAKHKDLVRLEKKYGLFAKEILDVYALHNGAKLFEYENACGFYMASIEEWDDLRNDAITWAEEVTWQEDKDEIPAYLYSAIAFGMIPGDSERWLYITEGKHAGKVMLSDTDLIDDEPRFESLAHFFATLQNDAPKIIGSGGYVHYNVGDEHLCPIQYLQDQRAQT